MDKVMFQFKDSGPAPSLHEVAKRFGVRVEDLDPEFGVIGTDPAAGLYCVMIDSGAAAKAEAALKARKTERDPAEGIFSNPRIEPFGPPKE
jgi:hypothetical protein